MDVSNRTSSWCLKESVWSITYGRVRRFLKEPVFGVVCFMKRYVWSPVHQCFPSLNNKAVMSKALNELLAPFQCFLLLSGLQSSPSSSQLPPPGTLSRLALRKVKIMFLSFGNSWSNVATVRDNALQCRFHGLSMKHCKVTVLFNDFYSA